MKRIDASESAEARAILNEYKGRLEDILEGRLVDFVLYGSRSRGTHHPGSDINVLCVLRGPFDYGRMIQKISEMTSEISLKHDVVVSWTFVSEQDYRTRNFPFMMNVRKEGVRV